MGYCSKNPSNCHNSYSSHCYGHKQRDHYPNKFYLSRKVQVLAGVPVRSDYVHFGYLLSLLSVRSFVCLSIDLFIYIYCVYSIYAQGVCDRKWNCRRLQLFDSFTSSRERALAPGCLLGCGTYQKSHNLLQLSTTILRGLACHSYRKLIVYVSIRKSKQHNYCLQFMNIIWLEFQVLTNNSLILDVFTY